MLLVVVLADACVFNANQLYYPSQVLTCLKTLPLNASVLSQTQRFLEYYLPQYVQEQHFSGTAQDLMKQLQQINANFSLSDKGFNEYMDAISAMFQSFSDTHFQFIRPSFYGIFRQISPVYFYRTADTWIFAPNSDVIDLYLNDSRFANLTSILNKTLNQVNAMRPDDYLYEFGAIHSVTMRDANARANFAVFSGFRETDLRVERLVDENISVSAAGVQAEFSRMVILTQSISGEQEFRALFEKSLVGSPFDFSGGNLSTLEGHLGTEGGNYNPTGSHSSTAENRSNPTQSHSSHTENPLSTAARAQYEGFFTLYSYQADFVLVLESFNPKNVSAGVSALISELEQIKARKNSGARLFVTTFGNYGGDQTVLRYVMRLLTQNAQPLAPQMKLKHSEVARLLSRTHNGFFPPVCRDVLTGRQLYSKADQAQLFSDGINLTAQQSGGFAYSSYFESDTLENSAVEAAEAAVAAFEPLDMDPNRLIIVSNGACASAAGHFSYAFKEKNLALHAAIGFESKMLCASAGGTSNSLADYYAAVREVLSDVEKAKQYSAAEKQTLQQYLPFDGDIKMNMVANDGFELSFNAQLGLDFREAASDAVFPNVHLTYPSAFTDQVLASLADVLAYDYSRLGFGKRCSPKSCGDGELFREVYDEQDKEFKCRKWACAGGYMQYVYGSDFQCVRLQGAPEKAKWGAKDTAITVLSCVIGVPCVGLLVLLIVKLRKRSAGGKTAGSGATYATDDQAYI